MKILFMGTPDFARESLEKLYNLGYEISGVVTTPDVPKGRGMKLVPCPVKEFAVSKNLKLFQPEKLKEIIDEIAQMELDLIIVVSYGKILPKSILDLPKYGVINVHPSLLPKYRGAAPIQWAVLNGDKTTGITIMQMNEAMDAGDIILQKEVEIEDNETFGELWDRLSKISSEMLIEALNQLENGTIKFTKQPDEFTLAPKIEKEMAKINWNNMDSNKIKNLVRGLNPYLGAYSFLEQRKMKFWKVETVNSINSNEIPGTVIMSDAKKGLFIKTLDGAISVLEIQGENSKKMPILDFLRGNKIEIGENFK